MGKDDAARDDRQETATPTPRQANDRLTLRSTVDAQGGTA
jgi:hypothetical protein